MAIVLFHFVLSFLPVVTCRDGSGVTEMMKDRGMNEVVDSDVEQIVDAHETSNTLGQKLFIHLLFATPHSYTTLLLPHQLFTNHIPPSFWKDRPLVSHSFPDQTCNRIDCNCQNHAIHKDT